MGSTRHAFRRGEGYVYDPARVEEAVARALASRRITARHRWYLRGDLMVVELEENVSYVFAKAVPGTGDSTAVHVRAEATLRSES